MNKKWVDRFNKRKHFSAETLCERLVREKKRLLESLWKYTQDTKEEISAMLCWNGGFETIKVIRGTQISVECPIEKVQCPGRKELAIHSHPYLVREMERVERKYEVSDMDLWNAIKKKILNFCVILPNRRIHCWRIFDWEGLMDEVAALHSKEARTIETAKKLIKAYKGKEVVSRLERRAKEWGYKEPPELGETVAKYSHICKTSF